MSSIDRVASVNTVLPPAFGIQVTSSENNGGGVLEIFKLGGKEGGTRMYDSTYHHSYIEKADRKSATTGCERVDRLLCQKIDKVTLTKEHRLPCIPNDI